MLEGMGLTRGNIFSKNLVVTVNSRNARIASLIFPFSKIIVWTHEPRYDSTAELQVRGFWGKKIDILNVFTGDVYWNNKHFFGRYHYDESINLGITTQRLEKVEDHVSGGDFSSWKVAVALFGKKEESKFTCPVNGINVDANKIRQEIAKIGHELGVCDILGSNWGGVAIEESGYSGSDENPWWERKHEVMSSYRFNIALENTIWPYYVTEKIWQSIRAYSLPVYWGKSSSIYETFPRDSFIDASEYSSVHDLFGVLSNMSYREWCERLNRCIETYNKQVEIKEKSPEYAGLKETIERLRKRLAL